jgi:hypothetical protein
VAVARVALEQGDLAASEERRLLFALARGLSTLHALDDAALVLEGLRARTDVTDAEREAHERERAFVVRTRARAQRTRGPPRCLGAQALLDAWRARLSLAARERSTLGQDLEKLGIETAALARKDALARRAVRELAAGTGEGDPFQFIEAAERELSELASERAPEATRPKADFAKKGTGFLDALKGVAGAAAAGMKSAAREAQLMLREAQGKARHDAALRAFGSRFARDLSAQGNASWLEGTQGELRSLAVKALRLKTALDFYADEEARAKRDIERLASLL